MKEAGELSHDEVARIAKFAEWGREYEQTRRQTRAPVIVLTGTELFASYTLQDAWKKKGGKHTELIKPGWVREENLRMLANMTQQLYLNMPSYETWRDARWKKKLAARHKTRSSPSAARSESVAS